MTVRPRRLALFASVAVMTMAATSPVLAQNWFEKLLSGGPRSGVSAAEIHEALLRAAAQAGVKVRLN